MKINASHGKLFSGNLAYRWVYYECRKKLNLLLVDDDSHCLAALRRALDPFDDVEIVGALQDGTEVTAFLNRTSVDAVFLDIEMDAVGGFSLAKHIQSRFPNVQIIFQTGHPGYAVDGYEYQPADFLVKPVNPIKVERALSHVREKIRGSVSQVDARIGIRSNAGLTIINVADVLYIEKSGRRVRIICQNGEPVLTSYSLQELQSIFASYDFIRCHQSFLVPIWRIRHIKADEFNRRTYTLQLDGTDKLLPLSRDRFDVVEMLLQQRGITIY